MMAQNEIQETAQDIGRLLELIADGDLFLRAAAAAAEPLTILCDSMLFCLERPINDPPSPANVILTNDSMKLSKSLVLSIFDNDDFGSVGSDILSWLTRLGMCTHALGTQFAVFHVVKSSPRALLNWTDRYRE